jgi:hypothetical protein
MSPPATTIRPTLPGLHATSPEQLPFDQRLVIRAFLLEREAGNILIYRTGALAGEARRFEELGGIARQYLNHSHEAMFGDAEPAVDAPLFVHEADAGEVRRRAPVRATFSRRHRLDDDFEVIPIPGHTPGATAYLWDTGEHRLLFTGDSIYLRNDRWVAAVLDSSDRDAYVASLETLRELDFDVLVPWAATIGAPPYSMVAEGEGGERIDAILGRLRRGAGH